MCVRTQLLPKEKTMTTLMHISASPRGQRSESLAIAATFLDELR
jgi:FMN-dependent NADH-azoreductase